MKVKHLLLTLAIPSAFAACSQDEFVNGTQGPNDNRPVVGPVSLDLSSGSSRWDWSSALGFSFDDNDYMGACQMDIVNDLTQAAWTDKYTISNNINTNYKYGYKDGWSNNDAIMSEGNYFFYMPYNNELKSRGALPYAIPAEQYAYDEKTPTVANATLAWKKNQMFIGYDDMMEGDKAAKPVLVEAHAKPRFNIKYTGSDAVVIERIVLTDATNEFEIEGTVKAAATAGGAYNPITGTNVPATYETGGTPNLAECFRAYNKAVAEYELKEGQSFVNPLVAAATTFLVKTANAAVPSLSLNFVPAKEVTGLMVMPAGIHTLTNVKVQVYTNKGLVEFTVAGDKLEAATANTGITYSNMNTLAAIKPGDGVKDKAVNINFADIDVTQPTTVSVSTTSQLESVIRWYATVEKEVTITTVGDKVEMSEIVYNTIKGNSKLAVKFAGTLTIPATIANDALDLLADDGTGNVLIAGTQNLINAKAATLAYDIEVLEGATLNITAGGTTTTTVAEIGNKGTVNVKGGKLAATTIINEAALTIHATATVDAKVLNAVSSKIVGGIDIYTQKAVITNNGNLFLKADSENHSTIINNSKLTISGATTNEKVAAVDKGTNGYAGVINNKDKSASYIYVKAAFANEGNIFNTGALYSQESGKTTNTGYIKAEDGSTTYVTDNASGEIELAKRNTETTVNSQNRGVISYTMLSADLDKGAFAVKAASDKFNTLRVGMDVSFAKTTAPKNIILVGANFTVSCADDTAFESIAAAGTSRYIVAGTKVETKKLTVSDTAVFQIPALSTFGVYDTLNTNGVVVVDEEAEVLVGGKFYANVNGGSAPNKGIFSSAGNGSYTWNDTTDNFGVAP